MNPSVPPQAPLVDEVRAGVVRLADLPADWRTPAVCMAAVERDGAALGHVPELLITPEMAALAVDHRGLALRCVPPSMRTRELCLRAVRSHGWAIALVPRVHLDEAMCIAAVSCDGLALSSVSVHLRSAAVCAAAVESSPYALEYVPFRLRTPALCLRALQHPRGAEVIREVPPALFAKSEGAALVSWAEAHGSALASVEGFMGSAHHRAIARAIKVVALATFEPENEPASCDAAPVARFVQR